MRSNLLSKQRMVAREMQKKPGFMRRREGFTLVELLVAMALTLFLMVILSEAFSAGLGAFRQLKAVCDLQEKLRTVASIMRRDLRANYYRFEKPSGSTAPPSTQDVHLSFFDFADTTHYRPPAEGFLRLWQERSLVAEGVDSDSIPSLRMGATDNLLHFSINLEKDGNYRPESYLSVPVTAGDPAGGSGPVDLQTPGKDVLNSQTAEVVYFLGPNQTGTTGTTKSGTFGGVPLFALHRRQLVAPASITDANTLNGIGAGPPPRTAKTDSNWPPEDNIYFEVSCKQDPQANAQLYFNTPGDLTIPERRFGMTPTHALAGQTSGFGCAGKPLKTGPNSYPTLADQIIVPLTPPPPDAGGDDILLPNVISFAVKILAPAKSSDFIDLFDASISSDPLLNQNAAINSYTPARVFDTWSWQTSGLPSVSSTYYDYTDWNNPAGATYNQVRMPMPIKVTAMQITLRVWDEKTERTRQITIVQDM